MCIELAPAQQSPIQFMVDSGENSGAEPVVEAARRVFEEAERAKCSLRADTDVGLQQTRKGKVTVDSDKMWAQIEARAEQRSRDSVKETLNV